MIVHHIIGKIVIDKLKVKCKKKCKCEMHVNFLNLFFNFFKLCLRTYSDIGWNNIGAVEVIQILKAITPKNKFTGGFVILQ